MSNDTTPATVRGSDSSEGLGGVDCIGLALDLEARATTVESQTTERAMRAAAHGLRLLAAAQPPERVPRCLSDAEIERLAAVDFPSKQWPACVRLLRAAGCVEPLNATANRPETAKKDV